MKTRHLGLVSLTLVGLGFGTLALASGGSKAATRPVVRPVAAQPAAEAPSPSFLVQQEQAVAQPRGDHRTGATPVVPRIASPAR